MKPNAKPNENAHEHNCYYMAEADKLWTRLGELQIAQNMKVAALFDPKPLLDKEAQESRELQQRMSELMALGLKHETECPKGDGE